MRKVELFLEYSTFSRISESLRECGVKFLKQSLGVAPRSLPLRALDEIKVGVKCFL